MTKEDIMNFVTWAENMLETNCIKFEDNEDFDMTPQQSKEYFESFIGLLGEEI